MQNVHFSPKEVAQMLGVNESTIKRWVDRGMLTASKTAGGHRRISQEDFIKFRRSHEKNKKHSYTLRRKPNTSPTELWKKYYNLLFNDKNKEAWLLISNMFVKNADLVDIVSGIISPALGHVGSEWFNGRIEIHDEHRMSFHIREHLVRLAELIPEPKQKKNVVLACISGDWHEIPLQISALILKMNGWNPIVLGVNTPEDEILAASKKWNAEITIVIKIYTKNKRKEFLQKLEEYICKEKRYLYYGGNGWSKKWRHVMNKNSLKYIKHFGDFRLFAREIERM